MAYAIDRETLLEHGELIQASLNAAISEVTVTNGELTLITVPQHLIEVLTHLRDNGACAYRSLIDVCCVDYPGREKRFEMVYHLLSMQQNQRIRVRFSLREDALAPSITGIYPAADWFEREAYDMYGVMFSGHPDLRRILTDYGFRGYPLRKDFPTTGYTEVRYDETVKRVVYEPVKLVQEFRQFDFLSPWEGVQAMLPGDEKSEG